MTTPLSPTPHFAIEPSAFDAFTLPRSSGRDADATFGQELFDVQRPEPVRTERRQDRDTKTNDAEPTERPDASQTDDAADRVEGTAPDRVETEEAGDTTQDSGGDEATKESEAEQDAGAETESSQTIPDRTEDAPAAEVATTKAVPPELAAAVVPDSKRQPANTPANGSATTDTPGQAPTIFGAANAQQQSATGQDTDANQASQPQNGMPTANSAPASATESRPAFAAPTLPSAVTPAADAPVSPTGNTGEGRVAAPPSAAALDARAGSDDADPVNAARLARGLRSALNQQGGAVTLRLTPPEMGTIRIQLDLAGPAVSARFHAETDAARNLLHQQLGQLRASLETQGLSVDRLSVQSIDGGNASQFNSQNRDGAPTDGRSRGQYQQQHNQSGRNNADDHPADFRDAFDQSAALDTLQPAEA